MNKVQKLVYVTLSESVVSRLSSELAVKICVEDLLLALTQVTRKELLDVAEMEIDYEFIKCAFTQSDIFKSRPIVLEYVELEESIIPDGTEQSLLEELIKHKGERWIIHQNDRDPFPSSPHAHNYEANLKLDLGNGGLYRGTKLVGTIGRRELITLRSKVTKASLPKLEV